MVEKSCGERLDLLHLCLVHDVRKLRVGFESDGQALDALKGTFFHRASGLDLHLQIERAKRVERDVVTIDDEVNDRLRNGQCTSPDRALGDSSRIGDVLDESVFYDDRESQLLRLPHLRFLLAVVEGEFDWTILDTHNFILLLI